MKKRLKIVILVLLAFSLLAINASALTVSNRMNSMTTWEYAHEVGTSSVSNRIEESRSPFEGLRTDESSDVPIIQPLDTGRNILYYLLCSKDEKLEQDATTLQLDLNLTTEQIDALRTLGLNEFQLTRELMKTSSSSRAGVNAYNTEIETYVETRNEQIYEILGDKNQAFREWISTWWNGEREYRNTSTLARADINRVNNIWATVYTPDTKGSEEVALPDCNIKFANMRWL